MQNEHVKELPLTNAIEGGGAPSYMLHIFEMRFDV